MTRVIPAIVSLLCLPGMSLGADAFDEGVPRDLVEQLTGGMISPNLPVDFPPFNMPDTIRVLGSLDNNFSQLVVFRTAVPPEEAGMEIAAGFEAAGWTRLVSINYEQPTNGFVYANQAPLPVGPNEQFCHDRFGTMTITPAAGTDLVNVRMANQALMQPGFSCQEQNAQRQRQLDMGRGGFPFGNLQNSRYVPRLELPVDDDAADTPQPPFRRFGGFSGSDNDLETQASVAVDMTAAEVNAHFAGQMEEQGWVLDSDWSGQITAGGNWSLRPEPDLSLIGILSVIERAEGVFDLKFRMVRLGTSTTAGAAVRGIIRQGVFANDAPIARPAGADNAN